MTKVGNSGIMKEIHDGGIGDMTTVVNIGDTYDVRDGKFVLGHEFLPNTVTRLRI